MKRMSSNGMLLAVAGTAVAAMFLSPTRSAIAGGKVKVQQDLTSTGSDPNARGKVRFKVAGSGESKLVVHAAKLDPNKSFDVLANGVKVGALSTSNGGGGKVRLSSAPQGNDGLLGFDPRGTNIVVRDGESGDDVLAGSVPDGTVDPTAIACCVPDGDGSECESLNAADCTAAGGTASTATSCLPDPCNDSPAPGVKVVCCLPNDGEAECEDRTESQCAADGGMAVDAQSCDPNPCAATPPATGEIACCIPHDNESECETETPDTCAALLGTATTATSCSPDPCGGSSDSGGDQGGGSGDQGGGSGDQGGDTGNQGTDG